jgi:L-histidine N-alpha-methyltransferase
MSRNPTIIVGFNILSSTRSVVCGKNSYSRTTIAERKIPSVVFSPPLSETAGLSGANTEVPDMPLNIQQEIIEGLSQPAASISPKYFYDARGSTLFEAITRLPEYYPTRTERLVMQTHAQAIAQSIGQVTTLIEPGAGSCDKARTLCRLVHPERFVGIDISADYLRGSIESMRAEFADLELLAVAADMSHAFELPADIPRSGRLLFYPGSSIGNFDPDQALALLRRMRALIDEEGSLLIGFDLPKDVAVLEAAYDDDAGVTAAFNLNVLGHVNQIIGSDFDLNQWKHHSFFNATESRIEMHLEASTEALVRWPGGERRFAAGERIHTENSYKYPLQEFVALLSAAGFARTQMWTDDRNWFAVVLARP